MLMAAAGIYSLKGVSWLRSAESADMRSPMGFRVLGEEKKGRADEMVLTGGQNE